MRVPARVSPLFRPSFIVWQACQPQPLTKRRQGTAPVLMHRTHVLGVQCNVCDPPDCRFSDRPDLKRPGADPTRPRYLLSSPILPLSPPILPPPASRWLRNPKLLSCVAATATVCGSCCCRRAWLPWLPCVARAAAALRGRRCYHRARLSLLVSHVAFAAAVVRGSRCRRRPPCVAPAAAAVHGRCCCCACLPLLLLCVALAAATVRDTRCCRRPWRSLLPLCVARAAIAVRGTCCRRPWHLLLPPCVALAATAVCGLRCRRPAWLPMRPPCVALATGAARGFCCCRAGSR